MTIYTVQSEQVWNAIRRQFAGMVFSRQEDGVYFIKMNEKYAQQLLETGAIQKFTTNNV